MEVSFEATQKQEASHTLNNNDCCFPGKLNSNQCYERSNGRDRTEQELKTNPSKLPRIVKTNSTSYGNTGNRCFKPSENSINDSALFVLVPGDVKAGPSRLQPIPATERYWCDGEKCKPSQIPRRRSNVSEAPIRPSAVPKRFVPKPPFKTQARNVQRIQVLNSLQDYYYADKRPITTSMATSRPIPTLGQIYRRAEDSNRVADWLLERDNSYLRSPISSTIAEQEHNANAEDRTAEVTPEKNGNTGVIITKKSSEKPGCVHHGPSTTNNWMSIHEYPTRDNESGYCSMSVGPHVPKFMNSKHSNVIPIVKQSEKKHYFAISETKSSNQSISSTDGNSPGMLLSEQQTVLLAGTTHGSDQTLPAKISGHKPGMSLTQNSKSAFFTKGLQFPSDNTFAKSYVDCPSEVFQKTTDFETAGYASSSSIAATDLEYREYSSRGTLENLDGNSMVEEAHQWSSTGTKSLNSFCCDLAEEQAALIHQTDQLSTKCDAGLVSTGTYRHYSNCCMLRRDRCKRLHGRSFFGRHYNYKDRLMATSSNKFKERRPSDMPRKRLSFRRMCQRRWNAVCQKTAERFANRPKSSMKIMKIKMMYAHPELFLEDVNVQTTSTVCADTGMGTVARENRSASIATSLKWVSPHPHFMDAATSGTIPLHKKPLPRYADFGPSMFPWQFNTSSKRKNTTPQNSENMSKKRRQTRSIPNYRPNDSRNTRSIKSLQCPNKLLKDESSRSIIIKDSTPSVSKKIQADPIPPSPLRSIESKTTIIISCPHNIKEMKKDQATDPDESKSKQSIFSCNNDSEVNKSSTITEHEESFAESIYLAAENAQTTNRVPSYQNVVLTGAGTKDFLHGKNEELIKSLQYSDLIYLEQPYTNNMIACNPAEVNLSFCAPSKCCQTGTSCKMHYLCDRSTSMEPQLFPKPTIAKASKGMLTMEKVPQMVSIGLSGFKLNHIEKKEASTETVSPLRHLGFQGPKIMSISSAFMTSPSVDTIRRETVNAGNSAKTIVLKDIQILTSSSLRHRPSKLVSCGTDTIHDVGGQSKATSVENMILYSETAKHYVPASINTDTSQSTSLGVSQNTSMRSSSREVSKTSSRPVALIDVCIQHNTLTDKPIKAYRSAAVVCSKMPSICKTEIGTSTVELNTAQDQVIETNDELSPSIGDCDTGTPKSGASSKMNADKWIKKCIASMEKDQITTILGQRSKNSKTKEKKNAKKASQFTLSSLQKVSSLEVSPFSKAGKKPDVPVAAMTCITCLKPQTSTPLLSTDVSEELMSKLMTEERTRSLLLKPTPYPTVITASDILRIKTLKGTPAQTALSSVQNAEIKLCGEKKSQNVFTSRYEFTSPAPCQGGSCDPHSPDCKFMYGRPRCLVHRSSTDTTVQMQPSQQDIVLAPMSADTPPRSISVATDSSPASILQCRAPIPGTLNIMNTRPIEVLPELLEITDVNAKRSFHSTAVSAAIFSPDLHNRDQNTEITDVIGQRGQEATIVKMSPPPRLGVDISTANPAPAPMQLTREQNTEFTGEFLSQAAKKPAPYNVTFSAADPAPARLTREQNTELTEEFLSQVLAARSAKRSPDAVASPTRDAPMLHSQEQNTELTEEFLSQVPAVVSVKKSTHDAIPVSTGAGAALNKMTRSANTKLIGDVYMPQNCIELLVCDSLAEETTQTFPGTYPPVIWFSRQQPVHFHDCNLMSSCRYYSKLLTEQITRVKENLAKHLTPSDEKVNDDHETQAEIQNYKEACTMKPSGRNEFACQTQVRRVPNIRQIRAMSCCTLNHAFSVTDICRGHESDLRTVYYLLSAIEGRIRRMKRHL